jgi:hypothetical protein
LFLFIFALLSNQKRKKRKKKVRVSVLFLFQVVRNFAKSIDRTNTGGVTWKSSVAEIFCQKKNYFWSKLVSFNSYLSGVFVCCMHLC